MPSNMVICMIQPPKAGIRPPAVLLDIFDISTVNNQYSKLFFLLNPLTTHYLLAEHCWL